MQKLMENPDLFSFLLFQGKKINSPIQEELWLREY